MEPRKRGKNAERCKFLLREKLEILFIVFVFQSMKWRQEWELDTTLKTWTPCEAWRKYHPSGCCGYDSEGAPGKNQCSTGTSYCEFIRSISSRSFDTDFLHDNNARPHMAKAIQNLPIAVSIYHFFRSFKFSTEDEILKKL